MQGKVVYFNFVKVFGFIEGGNEQFYFNKSSIKFNGDNVEVGSSVEFDPVKAPREGAKRVAVNVVVGEKHIETGVNTLAAGLPESGKAGAQ